MRTRVEGTIPESLAAEAEAARAWFAAKNGSEFKLTGIVDPEDVGEQEAATAGRERQLILCGIKDGQEVCLRERFDVRASRDSFEVIHLEEAAAKVGSPAPLLNPPVGSRTNWLQSTLAKHSFVVLVFYRGFW
jgi:hypothetical protein